MTGTAITSFVESLTKSVPDLKSVYDEHISDYDELLGHVFMGDVTRFIEQLYNENPSSTSLTELFKLFDKAFSLNDEYLKEVISVSFLENLSRDESSFEGIKNMLSDQLKEELSKYEADHT